MKTRPGCPAAFCMAVILLLVTVSSHAQVDVKFERDRMKAIVKNIADIIEKNFYDPQLRGLDWKALLQETNDKIDKANSPSGMVTAIFQMVNRLDDSHTVFLPPARATRIRFGLEMKAFGDEVRIYEIDKKGRAAAAGLQVGDRIHSVNGFAADRGSFDLMMLFFRRLRPVAALELVYSRDGGAPQKLLLEGHLTNEQLIEDLTQMSTIYKYIREAENEKEAFHYGSYDGGIGYVQIPSFEASDNFLHGLINKIKNSKATIVDLRGNPGGSTVVLSRLVGYFEPQETVIADLKHRQKTEPLKAKPLKPNLPVPLVVMVDSQSASAAEVFARHFQRSGRAQVIGDRTSGRVTASKLEARTIGVDIVVPYAVQVAVARVVFPDGKELEKVGVTPDVPCIPTQEQLREERDVCLSRARELARKALGLPETPAEAKVEIKP